MEYKSVNIQLGSIAITYPSSRQMDRTLPDVVSATAAGSRLIQFPEVCFLCLILNLIWPVPETLHLTWTNCTS